MNDPGLEEPISNDAKAVEENREKDEHEEAEEDEQEFLDPRFVVPLHSGEISKWPPK